MPSLHTRLLISASLVLLAFLGLAGVALDKAFRESAEAAVRERLQAQVYMLLAAADPDPTGRMQLPDTLPEARFSTPGSGLFGEVMGADGDVLWRSASALGLDIRYPNASVPGEAHFASVTAANDVPLFALSFSVTWEAEPMSERRYSFHVAENQQSYLAQVAGFRRSMWVWFSAAAVALLALQGVVLRWGLAPLRWVASELTQIERGKQNELSGHYPKEIRQLSDNLNALIRHSRRQLERYRNAMGDLAHSLKTPLAVLQGSVEQSTPHDELPTIVEEQVARMRETVDYQLQRAAASGRKVLAPPVAVEPLAQKVMASLEKVYADKSVAWSLGIEPDVMFHGDEGDLLEVLGNLGDNAFKWAQSRVEVRAHEVEADADQTHHLELEIEDDGPGMPKDWDSSRVKRGVRADPGTAGQGIGLAMVKEIVENIYAGNLIVDKATLGGTRLTVRI